MEAPAAQGGEAPRRRRRKKKPAEDGETVTEKQRVFDTGGHNRFENAKETFVTAEVPKKRRRKKKPPVEGGEAPQPEPQVTAPHPAAQRPPPVDVTAQASPVRGQPPTPTTPGGTKKYAPVFRPNVSTDSQDRRGTRPEPGESYYTDGSVRKQPRPGSNYSYYSEQPGNSQAAPPQGHALPRTPPSQQQPIAQSPAPAAQPARVTRTPPTAAPAVEAAPAVNPYPTDDDVRKERIGAALQEMQDKQLMIQQAMEKLSELKDAKRRCEAERSELRALNQQLAVQNSDLKQRHPLIIDPDNDLKIDENVTSLPRVELLRRFEDLYRKFCLEAQRNQSMNEAIMRMQNELITRNEEEKVLLTLQESHISAAHKLQDLQEEAGKLDKYKTTVKNQQQVIHKLDTIIATKLNGGAKGRDLMQRLARLRKTNGDLKGSVDVEDPECELLRREIRSLQAKLDDLQHGLPIHADNVGMSHATQQLEMELLKITEDNHTISREIEQLKREIAQSHQAQAPRPNPYTRTNAVDPALTEIQQLQLKAETLEAEVDDLTRALDGAAIKNAQEIKMWKVKYAELQAGLNGGYGEEMARTRSPYAQPVASRQAPTLHHSGQVRRPGSGTLRPIGSR